MKRITSFYLFAALIIGLIRVLPGVSASQIEIGEQPTETPLPTNTPVPRPVPIESVFTSPNQDWSVEIESPWTATDMSQLGWFRDDLPVVRASTEDQKFEAFFYYRPEASWVRTGAARDYYLNDYQYWVRGELRGGYGNFTILVDPDGNPLEHRDGIRYWGLYQTTREGSSQANVHYLSIWLLDNGASLALYVYGPPVVEFNTLAGDLQTLIDNVIVNQDYATPFAEVTPEASQDMESYSSQFAGWSMAWDPALFKQETIMAAELFLQHQSLPVAAAFMTVTAENPTVSSGLLSLTNVWTCADALREYNSAQIMENGQTEYPGTIANTESRYGMLLMDTEGIFSVVECHIVEPGQSMVWVQISIVNTPGDPFSMYEPVVQDLLEAVTVS